ncbi:hypothetical protein Golax_012293, partial [Gossypium laxum]|nr:hypothetical protein [Gossypium laxum]
YQWVGSGQSRNGVILVLERHAQNGASWVRPRATALAAGRRHRRHRERRWEAKSRAGEVGGDVTVAVASGQSKRSKTCVNVKAATGNFNVNIKLGSGGFGTVYKGVLRKEAVKRILKNTRHGKQDFIAEVTTISNLHHKNLVKLFGWCYESIELLLVYEHNIICEVAKALDYLHHGCEKRVLHRDVKASNIMLDSEFNARLGDFELARTKVKHTIQPRRLPEPQAIRHQKVSIRVRQPLKPTSMHSEY